MMSLPDNIQRAVPVLGCGEEAELEARDLRRVFKRRMLAQLPERHPSLASAHSKFEEILAAFVEVSPVRDESCQWSLRPLLVLSQLRIYEDTMFIGHVNCVVKLREGWLTALLDRCQPRPGSLQPLVCNMCWPPRLQQGAECSNHSEDLRKLRPHFWFIPPSTFEPRAPQRAADPVPAIIMAVRARPGCYVHARAPQPPT